ncbi:unnamed protein product [Peronospora farinosa]|uniref:Uncharacterized protein n=1 Tax=Peronospora farinosa TaxID=134698 RepID=A0ABN8CA01_9STRA|nr:unnamed protein product [Peronospora farinosa]
MDIVFRLPKDSHGITDEVASTLHWPFYGRCQENISVYTDLPRKLCTLPVIYVDMLKAYWDPSHVNAKALAPSSLALPQDLSSDIRCKAALLLGFDSAPTTGGESASTARSHKDISPPGAAQR